MRAGLDRHPAGAHVYVIDWSVIFGINDGESPTVYPDAP